MKLLKFNLIFIPLLAIAFVAMAYIGRTLLFEGARQHVIQHWFPKLSWPDFPGAVERLWTGERDWETIAIDLPEHQALILLLALEGLSTD